MLIAALVFFFGPSFAVLCGFRAQAIENRALTRFPSIHDGWKALPELGTWATDHLAGRKFAVKANDEVATRIFSEPPAVKQTTDKNGFTQVVEGKNGWLFLGDDFRVKCVQSRPAWDTIARITKLSNAVAASGRKLVFAIAPDKSDIYPQYLPNDYVGRGVLDCLRPQVLGVVRPGSDSRQG